MTEERSLDSKLAVPALIGDASDLLIIAGLAGTAKDIGALTGESQNVYLMGGAMGAAVPFAFGLAYAQPGRRVLAVTGDGDLMMRIGILSTIGVMQPPNLGILCVENGGYRTRMRLQFGYRRTADRGLGGARDRLWRAGGVAAGS